MKAITICQPWASAIIEGFKLIENRSWYTKYRGPLLIHAGKSRSRLCFCTLFPAISRHNLPFGEIIGRVDLIDCVPVTEVAGQPFAEGPWCWLLKNPCKIKPIYWKGQLAFFDVPEAAFRKTESLATISDNLPGIFL